MKDSRRGFIKAAGAAAGGILAVRGVVLVPNLLLSCMAAVAFAQPTAATVTVFEGARLISGDGGAPIEDSAFIVESGRLTRIGRRRELPVPQGAARVDLTGKTVMPVLVAIHAHLGYASEATFSAENYKRGTIVDQLDRLAYFGVGAALSLGLDTGELAWQLREEQRAGKLGGARLRTAGLGFVAPHGGPTLRFGESQPLRHVPHEVDSPDEARRRVRELGARKADMVKIWVDDRRGTVPKLRPEVYRAIIDEAHREKLQVMAHVYYLDDAKELVRAGVDGFAHLVRDREVDDELVTLMRERDVFTVTAFFHSLSGSAPPNEDPVLLETVPRPVLEQLVAASGGQAGSRTAEVDRIAQRNLMKLRTAGVRIALGADSGLPNRWVGYTDNRQLELMVGAGMTASEVIVGATRTSAEILRQDDLGTLAPGKSADFIVLEGNPLDDIAHTRRIAAVYQRGKPLDRASLRRRWTGGATSSALGLPAFRAGGYRVSLGLARLFPISR